MSVGLFGRLRSPVTCEAAGTHRIVPGSGPHTPSFLPGKTLLPSELPSPPGATLQLQQSPSSGLSNHPTPDAVSSALLASSPRTLRAGLRESWWDRKGRNSGSVPSSEEGGSGVSLTTNPIGWLTGLPGLVAQTRAVYRHTGPSLGVFELCLEL